MREQLEGGVSERFKEVLKQLRRGFWKDLLKGAFSCKWVLCSREFLTLEWKHSDRTLELLANSRAKSKLPFLDASRDSREFMPNINLFFKIKKIRL